MEHCREWARQGHQVTVMTCVPNFPVGKIFAGYKNRLWQQETMEGVDVIRVWTYITENKGFFLRTLDYLSFMAAAVLAAPFVRGVDVVVATSPHFFTACAGYLVGTMKRRPFIFELRDLWPESIRVVGVLKDGIILHSLERIEMFLYHHAAAIVSVTHSFQAALVARGVDGGKICVVTNGADLDRFRPVPKDRALAARLGMENKIVAGYVGTHGLAHSLHTILEAADRVASAPEGKNILFLLLGDGAMKLELKAKSAAMGLKNVMFLDTVPKADVPRYWSLIDIAIIHLKRDPLFTNVIPSKLFECMAMGLPVLHGVAGESARIVEKERAGLLFEPENTAELAEKVLLLTRDRSLRTSLGENGRSAAPHYDRKTRANEMLSVLTRVVGSKRLHPEITR
jgi:glycosyltransferase involved in cell wall biosynthesis